MENIKNIIEKMTLEEKAALCTGASPWTTTSIDRLGVPELTVSDGPHGVRRVPNISNMIEKSLPATCFPTASCTASTWDVDLLYSMGQAVAEECIALNVDVILGPGTNMKRTPLGGRNFEYFSEDPYLAGQMAASLINGIQSKGVGTSLKHFATNNQETQRLTISAEIDERTLREIYLPAFETAVKKGKPWTVMCAYNQLNGTYGSENHWLLVDILRDEWGFDGFVVSDWGAVHDRVTSLKAGLDLEMPGPRDRRVQAVIQAVRTGMLDISVLDEAVTHILGIVFKAGQTPKGGSMDIAAHHALARRIAAEGMVLLKNTGILPLKAQKHIAVIGQSAKKPYYQGGGSSHINPTQVDIPFDELQKLAGKAELRYAEGYSADGTSSHEQLDEAVEIARVAEVALVYLALPESKESEGYDRLDLDLAPQQVALIEAITAVQPNTVVILNNGAPIVMDDWIDTPAAVLEAWMMGQAGGGAIADVLYGIVSPSGKLAETYPIKLTDTPAYINFPGENGKVHYGEGIFIGYRYYDFKQVPVQFPFGYGLSYTTFDYQNLQVSSGQFKDVDGLTISVDVTNTGKVAGKEVVQLYVHDHRSAVLRPPKELKCFSKVELKPGETKSVTFQLDHRAFAYFHPTYRQWITEAGDFDILIGASSADIRCVSTVTMQSTQRFPNPLDRKSTVREWMENPRGKEILTAYINEMANFQSVFSEGDKETIGMDVNSFLLDMPLTDRFYHLKTPTERAPEEIVGELLKQVHEGD